MKKNILVIGGTGFIGFNLIKKLNKKKFIIFSLSRNKPKKNRLIKGAKYLYCNLSQKKKLKYILKNKNFNYIVNFGGDIDHKNARKVYLSHYIGLKNLAQIFLKKKIEKFIQIGSSIENGNIKSPQKENIVSSSSMIKSNYGRSKHMATKLLLKYHNNYALPVTIFRLFQVYGPYQEINRLIPFTIYNCLNDLKFPCSSGNQYRDFIYVDDVISLIIKSLNNYKSNGKIFNVGSGIPIKVNNIIKLILSRIKKGKPEFGKIKLRKDETKYIFANIKNTSKTFKWKPKNIFKKGIDKTIDYFKKYE